jgi:Na+/melibiose symporter-like transporter
MTQPATTPSAPHEGSLNSANPIAAHPVTSAVIFILVAGAICCTLIVPIYASLTPKVGDFPFFYFYLLAYMPVVAAALWIARLLQNRLQPPAASAAGDDAGTPGEAVR